MQEPTRLSEKAAVPPTSPQIDVSNLEGVAQKATAAPTQAMRLLQQPNLSGRGAASARLAAVNQLQRSGGNQATARLIQRLARQPLPKQSSTVQRDSHICDSGCAHSQVINRAILERRPESVSLETASTIQRTPEEDLLGAYNTLQPDLAAYANRQSGKKSTDFGADKLTGDSKAKALSLPRGADGQLTPEAIAMMDRLEVISGKQMVTDRYKDMGLTDNRAKAGFFNSEKKRKAKLLAAMGKEENIASLQTRFPELNNLLQANGEDDKIVTKNMDIGGVAMVVTYNPSDVNFEARVGLLLSAIEKVKSFGFDLPGFKLQVPKYSRQITVSPDCNLSTALTTSAAQYMAPDTIHLGSSGLNNPQEGKRAKPGSTTGEQEWNFTSTQVDPTGTGTIVHELGHALHYHLAPGKFHELSLTAFNKQGSEIANTVSGYASNTREFVAEVFLGLVYGKTYSADVIQMYLSLGGPNSPSLIPTGRRRAGGMMSDASPLPVPV